MIGWIIAAAILLLIGFFPLSVKIKYDADGTYAAVMIGPYKLQLVPKKNDGTGKKEKPKKQKKEAEPKEKKKKKPKQPGQGGSILDFWPFVELVWSFLGTFRRKLLLKELTLRICFGGTDAAQTAMNYGRAQAVLGAVYPRLRQGFRIQKENVGVSCDFTQDKMCVTAVLHIRVLVGDLLHLALVYGVKGLKAFLAFRKKRKPVCMSADTDTILKDKAVQDNESSSS